MALALTPLNLFLASPNADLTASWEKGLAMVENGEITPDEYMDKWGGEALRLLVEKHAIPAAIYYAKAVFDGSKRQRNT